MTSPAKTVDINKLATIRAATREDYNFIIQTWLKALRYGNSWFEAVDQASYYRHYHAFVERLLNSPGVCIAVTCSRDAPEVIMGYSVFSGPLLHFMYIKKHWRGLGLSNNLWPKGITTVTHLTKSGKALLLKHPDVKFNPFME